MKPKLAILLLLVLLGIVLETLTRFQDPPRIVFDVPVQTHEEMNAPAPDFTFTTLDKKTYTLSELKGKTVILNFWATWCAPCIKEFPALLDIAQSNPDDIMFLAVSVDEKPDKIAPFLDRLPPDAKKHLQSLNVLIAADPEKKIAQDLFGTTMFPETFIIGPNQTIRHKIVGEIDNELSSLIAAARKK